MKARIAAAVGALGLVVSTLASAGWSTTVQDDIFSGGKTAMLIGYISPYQSVVVDCNSEGLSLALLQQEKPQEGRGTSSWNLLVKVDGGDVHRFTAVSGRRNDKFSQYATADQDEIMKVLQDLRNAKSQVLFGLQSEEYNAKWSGTAPVDGSTRETDRFMQACKLKGAQAQ
jgi:hypothetical protein